MVKFEDAFEYMPKSGFKAGDGRGSGKYKFFTSSSEQMLHIDEAVFDGEFLIFGTGGNPSIHHCKGKFSTSTDCWVVKSYDDSLDVKYVYYFFKGNLPLLARGFRGAGLKHLSRHYLNAIQIPKPSLETQRKIVSILERAKKLKEMRAQADELTAEFLKAVFYEMFGDPVKNEKNWQVKKLVELSTIVRGSSPRPKGDIRYYGGSIPRLMIQDISRDGRLVTPKIDFLTIEGAKLSRPVPKNTLVMTVSGDVGVVARLNVDACIHDGFVGFLNINNELLNTTYLEFWLRAIKNTHVERKVGAIFQNLTTSQIKSLSIPLPHIEHQEKFTSAVEQVECLKQKQSNSRKQIEALFNVLMRSAFTGQLSGDS